MLAFGAIYTLLWVNNLGKRRVHIPLALQTAYSLVMARGHFNGTWRIMFSHQFEEKT